MESILDRMSRERVKGFLRAEGRKVVNGEGQEILLTGMGLGNWLLCEGYMWLSHAQRFERPRRIEAVVRQVAGSAYAKTFWKRFRDNYITRRDIEKMAEFGFNSVRIPINWRVLMEEEPGVHFREEGFALLDRCLSWCEACGLYAVLDLHGAPGGQTGSNIDDSLDDMPRLFMDQEDWDKGVALWREISRRYRDRWIVGAYDLLNEPLRTSQPPLPDVGHLQTRLVEFYDACIAAIRQTGDRHAVTLEGRYWATDPSIFYKKYDSNMIIHFHRYGCLPGEEAYADFLEASRRLEAPLWLGESGENANEWYAAIYPMALQMGFGYNVWPWKKMRCVNSPVSIHEPEGWEELLAYTQGGPKPSVARAQQLLDTYLENMLLRNCTLHPEVVSAVLRRPPVRVLGQDFDAMPGKGLSYSGLRQEGNPYGYRSATGMQIVPRPGCVYAHGKGFDSGWEKLCLRLEQGEWADYSAYLVKEGCLLALEVQPLADSTLSVEQDGQPLGSLVLPAGGVRQVELKLFDARETKLRLRVNSGEVLVVAVSFGR